MVIYATIWKLTLVDKNAFITHLLQALITLRGLWIVLISLPASMVNMHKPS